MSLDIYKKKRDFDQTPEPSEIKKESVKNSFPIFVIQKHNANRLHYDLRLEANGVLKSWAVPKGPTLDPEQKHLAMHVEDHPYEYAYFEGVIPKGNYGAGQVIVWDIGRLLTPTGDSKDEVSFDIEKGIKEGHVTFFLNGEKLKGEFALVKIKDAKEDNAWLLIKAKDEFAGKTDITEEDRSVLSSVTIESLKEQPYIKLGNDSRPNKVKPMLAKTTDSPFDGEEWLFEIKWDGYRMISDIEDQTVNLYSRNLVSFNDKFLPIKKALEEKRDDFILDGEVVAYDEKGQISFNLLENYQPGKNTIIYYVFDLLYLRGKDMRNISLIERKEKLKEVLSTLSSDLLRYNDHIIGTGKEFFALLKQKNIEGMIAKRINSTYLEGTRSDNWFKIRNLQEIEAVIGGFTTTAARKSISALLLGIYKDNKLQYIGKVGTGFNEREIKKLQEKFAPTVVVSPPFAKPPSTKERITWLNPVFECLVQYTEWTPEGYLRHPVYHGLTNDPSINNERINNNASTKIL